VLHERRKALHEHTAQAIETLFHSRLEDHYGDLAHHYSRSGNTQKAVEYLQFAGQRAVERSANGEAIAHFSKGLELLKTLPDTPERAQQELALQIALSVPLRVTKGFAAPEVERVYTRARELCQQVGETPQLFPVLWGLWELYFVRAEHRTAHELGEQFLTLAQRQQDPTLLLQGHHAEWSTLMFLGELAAAREHTVQGSALYRLQEHRSHAFLYGGHDPGVCCLSIDALALWHLGYPDQALQRSHEALTLAHKLAHPFSVVFALRWAAIVHQLLRDEPKAQEQAEALIALSSEQGFEHWLAGGTIFRGWVLTEQGQAEAGIAQICQGMAGERATGAEFQRPYHLALLADAYGTVGQVEEGFTALTEALATVDIMRNKLK
jgi:predicted ATPase